MGIDDELPAWVRCMGELYPNPAGESAAFSILTDKPSVIELDVIDLTGQQLQQRTIMLPEGSSRIELELQNLKSGVYFVNIHFEEAYVLTKKLLVIK